MLPNTLPSTCRALGSRAAICWRRAGMPLEPPVKNTVSTCSTLTPALPSNWLTLPRTRSSRLPMAALKPAWVSSTPSSASMRASDRCRRSLAPRGALFDQLEQTVDAGRVEDVVAHALQRQLGFLRVHRVDGVPGGQVEVNAGGHRRVALHPAAIAEQWHHRLQAELFVEVGAADMDAAGGEDVGMPFGEHMSLGRQANQREVRGTAADVDDQHQFFLADGAFVVKRSGNRLVLERHVLETDGLGHACEGVGGLLVGLLVVV